MSFRFKNKLILAKLHSAYDTDPVPVEATNAILTQNLTVSPYEGSLVSRNLDRGALGGQEEINVGAHVMVEFDIEASGSSAVATAPAYSCLMTACAHEETITAITGPIEYDPESLAAGFDASAIYFNHDGEQQIILGCRGSVSLEMNAGQLPHFHYRLLGIYARPTAVAQYNPTLTPWIAAQPVNKANTGTISIHGHSAVLESFKFDQNANVVYRNLPGSETVEITDRDPKVSLVIEAPPLATKDFYAAVESHSAITKAAIQVVHGSVSTNRVTFDASYVQLISIKPQDSDGVKMYALEGKCIASSAGDDEYKITVTGP